MKKKQMKKQYTNSIMIVLAAAAAIAVLFLVVWNAISQSGFLKQSKKAFQVGEESYTVAEVNYYYFSALYALSDRMPFDIDWHDYIVEQEERRLAEVSSEYQEALAEGYTEDAVIRNNIENAVEYHRMSAAEKGYSDLDSYLGAEYGLMNEQMLRNLLKQELIAGSYENDWKNSCEFGDEELYDYYEQHLYEYSTYSYLYAYAGKDVTGLDAFRGIESEEEFRNITKEYTGTDCYEIMDVPGSELGEAQTEDLRWISDSSRKEGDLYFGESEAGCYVLYFLNSSDHGFTDQGDQWKIKAQAGLKEERLKEWKSALAEEYGFRECSGFDLVGK